MQNMKPTRFEVVALLITSVVITYYLFVPPIIGLADSGDFERILPWRGLAHVSNNFNDKYFSYFNSRYRIIPRVKEPDWYKTSTSLLIMPARWFSIRIGQDQFFDIRILAAVHALIFLCGFWLILVSMRSIRLCLRIILSALLIVIFADVGYIAYFNSFFSEGTALCFLAVAIGCALILINRQSTRGIFLFGYFAAIGLMLTSKPMYIPLTPALALLGLHLSRYVSYSRRYWLSGCAAVGLCLTAAWYFYQTPRILNIHSIYIGLFLDLLPNSPHPQDDLTELGLNPNYALFSGTTPYQIDSPLNDPRFELDFSSKVSSLTLPLFYLKHPSRLYELSTRCVKYAFSTRVERLGYYESHTGKPPLSKPFGIWSNIRENLFPRSLWFFVSFSATGIVAIVLLLKTSSNIAKGMYFLYVLFVFIASSQFLVAILVGGGESDVEKHLFMFNLAFDVCLILLVLGAANLLQTSNLHFISKLTRFRILRPHRSNHVT